MRKYGYFDDKEREYVIINPATPLPWINYIGNDSLQGFISHTAGGYTFYKDPRLMRITRYRYNNIPFDMNGRFIYIKLNGNDIYSPTFKPCMKMANKYECHHGIGYTRIISQYKVIRTEITYFIPLNDNVEIWDLKITNIGKKSVELDIYPFVEFCLWNALDDFTNFQRNFSTGEVYVKDNTIYHITEYRERRDHFAYFTSNENPLSFETRRNEFIGVTGLINRPEQVEKENLANGIAQGWAPAAIFQYKVTLAPGGIKRIIFQLGYFKNSHNKKFIHNKLNTTEVKKIINKYRKYKNIDAEFKNLKEYWWSLLNKFQVNTSNEYVNKMVNIWNQYQNIITYKMSRSASFYESGIGRGMGFRDSNQDILGFVHILPEKARERIFDLASTQLENGHAYHQYQPLTKRGNTEFGSNYNDDPLWLVISVSAYLKETGDFKFLDTMVPYENNPSKATPLYEHLTRALTFTVNNKGPHNLPLIGRADWNDCLNLNTTNTTPGLLFSEAPVKDGKIAESIFIGMLFIYAAKEFKRIAKMKQDYKRMKWIEKEIKDMEKALIKYGWDGEWWLRAYDSKSRKVGSRKNKEGKIFIEPQGWDVIANVGTFDMQRKALDSVNKFLATEHGIVLQQPAYTKYYLHLGEISTYPPGYKENAGIFCHSNSWIIVAEAILGNSKQALDYYLRLYPVKKQEIVDTYKCEPYVYAQMIAGKDAPTFGEAKNSWLTGTASWMFVAISQYILGIRPDYKGLIIQPSVPINFGNYYVERIFRGTLYKIWIKFEDIENPYYIENHKKVEGNYIKHINKLKERKIIVKLQKQR